MPQPCRGARESAFRTSSSRVPWSSSDDSGGMGTPPGGLEEGGSASPDGQEERHRERPKGCVGGVRGPAPGDLAGPVPPDRLDRAESRCAPPGPRVTRPAALGVRASPAGYGLPPVPSGSAPFGTELWSLLLFGLLGLLWRAPTVLGAIRSSSSSTCSLMRCMMYLPIVKAFAAAVQHDAGRP